MMLFLPQDIFYSIISFMEYNDIYLLDFSITNKDLRNIFLNHLQNIPYYISEFSADNFSYLILAS